MGAQTYTYKYWLTLLVTYVFSGVGASDVGTESFDVLVSGATGAGCVAAIAASRAGASRVLLLSTNTHIGGMLTGGLQHTDSTNASVMGGITREIFIRCERVYPGDSSSRFANVESTSQCQRRKQCHTG